MYQQFYRQLSLYIHVMSIPCYLLMPGLSSSYFACHNGDLTRLGHAGVRSRDRFDYLFARSPGPLPRTAICLSRAFFATSNNEPVALSDHARAFSLCQSQHRGDIPARRMGCDKPAHTRIATSATSVQRHHPETLLRDVSNVPGLRPTERGRLTALVDCRPTPHPLAKRSHLPFLHRRFPRRDLRAARAPSTMKPRRSEQ